MTCTNCSHAKVDHLTGKCVNRQTRFDPAIGAVVTLCPCKAFEEAKKAAAKPAGIPGKAAAAPSEVHHVARKDDPTTESVGTAPAAFATEHAPATKTPVTRRNR